MTHKDILTDFYKAYLEWVETDENPYGFTVNRGLCSNLINYGEQKSAPSMDTLHLYYQTKFYQEELFRKADLDLSYPFDGNADVYFASDDKRDNEARIQWIKDFLAMPNIH